MPTLRINMIGLSQSERANPGVRLTLLDREAETVERLMRGVQPIGIFADAAVTAPR